MDDLKITKDKNGAKRPDAAGSFLNQARHFYNDLEDVTDEVVKAGVDGGISYLQDTKYRFLKTHYYSWGLFWSQLLKQVKNRQDLKDWSPELYQYDVTCPKCEGRGKTVIPVGSPAYEEWYADEKESAQAFGDKLPEYGTEVAYFCSPCQGVGFYFDREAYRKDHRE